MSLATIPGLTVFALCRAWPFTLGGPLRHLLHFSDLFIPSAVKSAEFVSEAIPFAFRCAILLSFSVLRVAMLTAVDGASGDMIIAPIVRQ